VGPIGLIGGGLKILGGLFGRSKSPTPAENIVSQARGARKAADEYGFNPLTMLQYGQPGGSMAQGDVPPLASLSILGDMLTDNFGPDAKDRREHNQLNNDLLRLQLDQARGLVRQPSDPSAVAGLTDRAPALGRSSTTTVATVAGRGDPRMFGIPTNARDWMTPGRETTVEDNKIRTGLIHTDNAITGPVTMLSADGDEPLLEYIQTPLAYGTQVPWNWASLFGANMKIKARKFKKQSGLDVQDRPFGRFAPPQSQGNN